MPKQLSEANPRLNRRTGHDQKCLRCENVFWKRKSDHGRMFCSSVCGNSSRRKYEKRDHICKSCNKIFVFSEKPRSNSVGNYCSLKCRNDGYVKATKSPTHTNRTRWKFLRNNYVKLNDFCNICGQKPKRIEVHHIEPYRISMNDDLSNLVALCHKCHSKEEIKSKVIARLPAKIRQLVIAIKQAHFHDAWHLYKGRELENRTS